MSNIFKQVDFMPGATTEELKDKAIQHAGELMSVLNNIPNMNDMVFIKIFSAGIRIAVDGKINDREMELITAFFNEICTGVPTETFTEIIEDPVDDRAYKIVEDLFQMSPQIGMSFCNFIMCFAYVDGVFEDEVSQKLSDIVTNSINIFVGTPSDFLNGR